MFTGWYPDSSNPGIGFSLSKVYSHNIYIDTAEEEQSEQAVEYNIMNEGMWMARADFPSALDFIAPEDFVPINNKWTKIDDLTYREQEPKIR